MVDFQSRDTSRNVDEDEDATGDDPADDAADDGPDDDAEGGANDDRADEKNDSGQDPTSATVTDEEADARGESVAVAILVTDDAAGETADEVAAALSGGHDVLGRDARTGDLDAIQAAVNTFLDQPAVDAVVTVGGVAVGPRQVTVGAVSPLLDAELPGFGELVRRRHERQAGSAAVRSRAFAGIADEKPVFCLPADGETARAAAADLVAPELGPLVAAADGT